MTITIKLFGPQSQIAGTRELSLRVGSESPTVADLRRALAEESPRLAPTLPNSRLAVNFEFADDKQTIRGCDEVALIGMVCGG